jgi:hypothetical protein
VQVVSERLSGQKALKTKTWVAALAKDCLSTSGPTFARYPGEDDETGLQIYDYPCISILLRVIGGAGQLKTAPFYYQRNMHQQYRLAIQA